MNPKNKNRFTLDGLLLLVALFGLLAALALPASAQLSTNSAAGVYQTGQPNFANNDTNAAYALTNNQTLIYTAGSTNTYIKTIRQNQGLGLFLAVWQTNSVASTTTNYTVRFDVTGDGTTWTSGTNGRWPITWTVSLAGLGASTNVFWTNLPATLVSNFRKIQMTSPTTTASNNIFGALLYSQATQ
jgi:hypothetical protein